MLLIYNDGEVETAALTLMGATSKEGDSSKIGFFGSGNKYAIATLLRNHVNFRIFSGVREVQLSVETTTLRGVAYERIIIDGVATSLTTRMGPDWELWFALREFVCNAKDEGGYELSLGDPVPVAGKTLIAVDEHPIVVDFYENINKYIRDDPVCVFSAETEYGRVDILEKDEKTNIYRKGISVIPEKQRDSTNSLYSYDFSSLTINEARTYAYDFEVRERIAAVWAACTDAELIKKVIDAKEGLEVEAHWHSVSRNFSQTWHDVLAPWVLCAIEYREHIVEEDRDVLYLFLKESLLDKVCKQWHDLRRIGAENESGFKELSEVSPELSTQLETACKELASYRIVITVPIKIGVFSNAQTVATWDPKIREIHLSAAYMNDYEELLLTLMEEHYHSEGYNDGSRYFEHMLMGELLQNTRTMYSMKKQLDSIRDCLAQEV